MNFLNIIEYINELRDNMVNRNSFFQLLRSDELPVERKILFIPYMVFFSVGCPDVMTLEMKTKGKCELSDKVNKFIEEDNFHYNFYLNDFISLGYDFNLFKDSVSVIRHVFSDKSIPVRKLIYNLAFFCIRYESPLYRLVISEILEAGLYDLFTIFFSNVVEKNHSLNMLEYFGKKHVSLEQNHTVTGWFSGSQETKNSISNIAIPDEDVIAIKSMCKEIMDNFYYMYLSFEKIIESDFHISKNTYDIKGTPPIDVISSKMFL